MKYELLDVAHLP